MGYTAVRSGQRPRSARDTAGQALPFIAARRITSDTGCKRLRWGAVAMAMFKGKKVKKGKKGKKGKKAKGGVQIPELCRVPPRQVRFPDADA